MEMKGFESIRPRKYVKKNVKAGRFIFTTFDYIVQTPPNLVDDSEITEELEARVCDRPSRKEGVKSEYRRPERHSHWAAMEQVGYRGQPEVTADERE